MSDKAIVILQRLEKDMHLVDFALSQNEVVKATHRFSVLYTKFNKELDRLLNAK